MVHAPFIPRMSPSDFSSYLQRCGEHDFPRIVEHDTGASAEFSSVHKKLLAALRDPVSASAQRKHWIMSIARTHADRKQAWANVVAAYRFCGWGLGMFCLPTSVVTGLPSHLSAINRRFAIGSTLDEIHRGVADDEDEDLLVRAIEPYSPQQLASLYVANLLIVNPDLNPGNLIVFDSKNSRLPVTNSSLFAVIDFDFALGALDSACSVRAHYANLRTARESVADTCTPVPCTGDDFRQIPAEKWGEYQSHANAFFHLLVRRCGMQMPESSTADEILQVALDTTCSIDFVQRVVDPLVITKGNGLDVFYGLVADKSYIEDRAKHLPHLKRLEWFAELLVSRKCVTPRLMIAALAEKEFL